LLSLSTVRLSYSALALSLQQVCAYVQRFKNRLSSINVLHLKRLVVFLDALKKAVTEWKAERLSAEGTKAPIDKSEVMTLVDFTAKLGKKASSINLLEIEGYLKKSKVCDCAFLGSSRSPTHT
jgi:chromosome transmission fidelity protein 1